MLVETIELKGRALDWAVSEIEYAHMEAEGEPIKEWAREAAQTNPGPWSTDWLWGGPIIEREGIATREIPPVSGDNGYIFTRRWIAEMFRFPEGPRRSVAYGPTPLIAAMRCFVALKLGKEIEVPDGLMEEA